MRTARVLPIIALVVLSAAAAAQSPAPKGDKGGGTSEQKVKKDKSQPVTAEETEAAKRRTERLFGADEPLEITLAADFKAAFKSRDTLNVKPTKATLTVKDSSGNPVSIPIEITPRGTKFVAE